MTPVVPTLELSAKDLVNEYNQVLQNPTTSVYNLRATRGIPETEPFDVIKNQELESQGKNVHSFDLSGAPINSTTLQEIVALCPNMVKLSLAGCRQLNELPENFHALNNLKWLDISNTKISELDKSFCTLKALEVFIAYMTPLKSLPSEFNKLSRLKDFVLAYAPIKSLPKNFGQLNDLNRLVIEHTHLSELPEGCGRLQCRAIVLKNNQLTKLPKYLMWTNLRYLLIQGDSVFVPKHYEKYTLTRVKWPTEINPDPFAERHLPIFEEQENKAEPRQQSKSAPPSEKGTVSALSRLLDEIQKPTSTMSASST